MAEESFRAVVADAHPLCCSGMTALLAGLGYSQILTASDFDHLKRALSLNGPVQLLSVSIDLPGLDQATGLRRLRLEWPELRIMVLSETADRNLVLEMISAGVHGFIPKTYSESQMRAAVEAVDQGQIYVPNIVCDLRSSPVAVVRTHDFAHATELTERQCEVLRLLAAGKSNKEIARTLQISEGTVKVHVNASFRALGVHNRVNAAAAIAGLNLRQEKHEPFIPGLVTNGRRRVDSSPSPLSPATDAA